MPDPQTKEMQVVQDRREQTERDAAVTATDEHETATHERRADRAAYLKAKLAERARSEEEAEHEPR